MKNIEKFLETYEEIADECFKKWGYYHPPRTWDEFTKGNKKYYDKYVKNNEDDVKKLKSSIRLADDMNDFGFYLLYKNFDYGKLNDILYQISRQKLLNNGMLASGTDHCNVLFNTFTSFACNDFTVINHFFPEELPQSKGKYYTEVSVNLLKILYYNQYQFESEALEKADKFLSKKITAWEKYTIQYFKALIIKNAEEASNSLQELCTAYQRMEHSVNKLRNKLEKYFAYEINGIYRFAMFVNPELFEKIKEPKHNCFSNEFEEWQKENNFPKGKLFYKYPQEMDFMNKIFEAELPMVELFNPYPNGKKVELYKNTKKFIEDLIQNSLEKK